jgi:hypothetical protein
MMKPQLIGVAFYATATLSSPSIASAEPGSGNCPPLLMASECRVYQEKIRLARTDRERTALQGSYAQLLKEREQACGCDKTSALRPYGERIRDLPEFISNYFM